MYLNREFLFYFFVRLKMQEMEIGYDIKMFLDPEKIPPNCFCKICSNVLRNPIQVPHEKFPQRVCHDCYQRNLR